ncbi:hypothetical protein [Anaerotignum sp. MB30-C6]|uniref:hypothetical protein n=1 Tax=Anaerotignum sp. MB30-C6 TaxID=3070814 RepID=UPI0027DD9C7E|nr:hypothetical protein [Anaerotignum sp. MB30-C6]WMI80901.1 hypothetical protein RBQ60_13940 [Anaerotignum sp. MB30-C6]
MQKGKMEQMTFDELIAMRTKKEERVQKPVEILIPSAGKTMIFSRPKDEFVLEIVDEIGLRQTTEQTAESYRKLIYHCCSMLQKPELHEQLEVKDPYDVVRVLFELADILEVGSELLGASGIGSYADEVKN